MLSVISISVKLYYAKFSLKEQLRKRQNNNNERERKKKKHTAHIRKHKRNTKYIYVKKKQNENKKQQQKKRECILYNNIYSCYEHRKNETGNLTDSYIPWDLLCCDSYISIYI